MTTLALAPGFSDPALQSADAFREILDAMARPGRIKCLIGLEQAPPPLMVSTAILLLTLADMDTPLWLDDPLRSPEIEAFVRFHCGAPLIETKAEAAFAIISTPHRLGSIDAFSAGTAEYPDRSTTVIIQVETVTAHGALSLKGPGIETVHHLGVIPDYPDLWPSLIANHRQFPLGVDVIFAAPQAIAAIPRSTALSIEGAA